MTDATSSSSSATPTSRRPRASPSTSSRERRWSLPDEPGTFAGRRARAGAARAPRPTRSARRCARWDRPGPRGGRHLPDALHRPRRARPRRGRLGRAALRFRVRRGRRAAEQGGSRRRARAGGLSRCAGCPRRCPARGGARGWGGGGGVDGGEGGGVGWGAPAARAPPVLQRVRGVLVFGYPVGSPDRERPADVAAVHSLGLPILVVQGSRDSLGPLPALEAAIAGIGSARIDVGGGGDHSYRAAGGREVVARLEDQAIAAAVDWLAPRRPQK